MLTRLLGAVVRAIIVIVVISTPSLLIPGTTPEGAQMVMLVALAMGVFIAVEYGATYPGLVEFRDAPPFNRVRIVALFLTLFALSLVMAGQPRESTLSMVINALGLLVGQALDFPYSPLRVVIDNLPQSLDAVTEARVQAMAGLSVLVNLISLTLFSILLRMHHWPNRGSAFNVWINLPTFDPTTGGDVVARLNRDARINLILGFSTPFLIPVISVIGANQLNLDVAQSPHTLVWAVTLWMFLPLSMFMRGLAMGRVADMIRERRARLVAAVAADAPSSVSPSSRSPAYSR